MKAGFITNFTEVSGK